MKLGHNLVKYIVCFLGNGVWTKNVFEIYWPLVWILRGKGITIWMLLLERFQPIVGYYTTTLKLKFESWQKSWRLRFENCPKVGLSTLTACEVGTIKSKIYNIFCLNVIFLIPGFLMTNFEVEDHLTPDIPTPSSNPSMTFQPQTFQPWTFRPHGSKFMFEKSWVENFMSEKSGVKRSVVEAWGWKVRGWDFL